MHTILSILWIEKILYNPWILLLLFVSCTTMGCLVKIFLRPKKKMKLKGDFAITICTALGIFGLVGENRIFFSTREMNTLENRIDACKYGVSAALSTSLYDRTFSEASFLHEEHNDIVNNFSQTHHWILDNRDEILEKIDSMEYISLDTLKIPKHLSQTSDLIPQIQRYNENLLEYNEYRDNTTKNDFEIIYSALTPVFFLIGLTIKIIMIV